MMSPQKAKKRKPAYKIVIVEDDKYLAQAYHLKLQNLNFNVNFANDGEAALQIIEKVKPDLIILDLIIPKINGLNVLKSIRQNKAFDDKPIIVSSNLGQKEELDEATKYGANDFIIKTNTSLEMLVEKINFWLKK